LARVVDAPIAEIDDIVEALFAMTTPADQPVLHYWRTHPDAHELPPDKIVELHLAVARALGPAIEAVITSHLAANSPVIIEGDYLLPEMAVKASFGGELNGGRVRAVFLIERNEARLVRNFGSREPDQGDQTARSRVSHQLGEWLADAADRVGVPVVPAGPWSTLLERAVAAFGWSMRA
jgi:2-phosphoglycerate kinase